MAKVGRPSKYTPELLERATEYMDGAWKTEGDAIPMLCGLAVYCGITEKTVQEWKNDPEKQEFGELCARVMDDQKRSLINKGLTRESDASLSKLLLMKHGYSEKQDVDVTSKGKEITGITRRVIHGSGDSDA